MPVSTSPSSQCLSCQSPSSLSTRNLAVFIDGTSDKPGRENTNVFQLYADTLNGDDHRQCTKYIKGIGAHYTDHLPALSRMKKAISSRFEMAFAQNVGENVRDAYAWLVKTYRQDDRIYLFGFSRGAYQVRALASMIHDVGLVRKEMHCDRAYESYLSIDPHKPETRFSTARFKKRFCWQGVRVHFIGVWDTVSSLGFIKKDVHVTASASVTNACHFRHALALDELRVKFLPEYFGEMNAHHSSIQSARSAIGDVKEVWFAGSHSDVGGTSREQSAYSNLRRLTGLSFLARNQRRDNTGSYVVHAGRVPLEWMRLEAEANGLAFEPNEIVWDPQDVDFGTKESMTLRWRILEVFPIRHQVSFSGTGEHGRRWHLCRPRPVIPSQQIHPSVFSADVYVPRATLGSSSKSAVPIILRRSSGPQNMACSEGVRSCLLESLLRDQQTTFGCLEKVLFLVDSMNYQVPRTEETPMPPWTLTDLQFQDRPFARYALTIIYDITANSGASEESLKDARRDVCAVLQSPDHLDFTRALYVLRFSTKHPRLRGRFIDGDVTSALMDALERASKSSSEVLFPLVIDSLCYLITDAELRGDVIGLLHATVDGTGTPQTRISSTLQVKAPVCLMASLKMVSCLAQHDSDHCEQLAPRVYELAKKRCKVGSSAVEALVAMNKLQEATRDIYIGNVLDYLGNVLPPLDAEVSGPLSPDSSEELPVALRSNGSEFLSQEFMRKLVLTVESCNDHERTAATLTFVKLSKSPVVPESDLLKEVLDIFVRQLGQKKTSLLAAYALKKCLERRLWTSDQHSRAANPIIVMVKNGWFDNAIGRVEGCDIFRGLMGSADLRKEAIKCGIVRTLIEMLEGGERHRTRMGSKCLDILDGESPLDLTIHVKESIHRLEDKDGQVQMKGVKTLAALAQTVAGERAIKERLTDIVQLLLREPSDPQKLSPSQMLGPVAVLYGLCKNETLRKKIQASPEFSILKDHNDDVNALRLGHQAHCE